MWRGGIRGDGEEWGGEGYKEMGRGRDKRRWGEGGIRGDGEGRDKRGHMRLEDREEKTHISPIIPVQH